MFNIPLLFIKIKAPIATTGIIIAHAIPKSTCLYFARKSLIKRRITNSFAPVSSLIISKYIFSPLFTGASGM